MSTPPLSVPTPTPGDWGQAALDFLNFFGFTDRVPCIRSSDYRHHHHNPLSYLLTRRFSIGSPRETSRALRKGSWFHDIATIDHPIPTSSPAIPEPFPTPQQRALFETKLEARLQELVAFHRVSGSTNEDRLQSALTRERKDAYAALAWYTAMARIPYIEPLSKVVLPSFRHYLCLPTVRVLDVELEIEVPASRGTSLVIQIDALVHLVAARQLLIFDYKTTTLPLQHRLSFCPFEFQTQLYTSTLRQALHLGILHQKFPDLPRDISIMGMNHVGVHVPKLEFGREDRHYTETTRALKSGPRKGELTTERIFDDGPPDPALYFRRVADWMLGTGRYADLDPERNSAPCLNTSHTPVSVLDGPMGDLYHSRLNAITTAATRPALPKDFPPSDGVPHNPSDPFIPFYTTSPYEWPGILAVSPLTVLDASQSDRRVVQVDA